MRKARAVTLAQEGDSLKATGMMTVDDVGTTAGRIWGYLVRHGKVSLSALEKGIDTPHDLGCMAIGWLAREGKVEIKREKRSVQVWLT